MRPIVLRNIYQVQLQISQERGPESIQPILLPTLHGILQQLIHFDSVPLTGIPAVFSGFA